MAPHDFKPDEEALRTALQEWRVSAPLPPGFRQHVWRGIETEATLPSPWSAFRSWFESTLSRPAVAVTYVSVLIFLGLTLGLKQGHQASAHLESKLSVRYLQSVDPYQAPRH